MFLPDLSPYQLSPAHPPMIAVGWLDRAHPYDVQTASRRFLSRLHVFCTRTNIGSMGIHECEFCPQPVSNISVQDGTHRHHLGSGIMLAFGQRNSIYAAPDLVYHYVCDHHYAPPSVFIQAILRGPLPTTRSYRARRMRLFAANSTDDGATAERLRMARRRFEEETLAGRVKWWIKDHNPW
jgi:hypothetical protein